MSELTLENFCESTPKSLASAALHGRPLSAEEPTEERPAPRHGYGLAYYRGVGVILVGEGPTQRELIRRGWIARIEEQWGVSAAVATAAVLGGGLMAEREIDAFCRTWADPCWDFPPRLLRGRDRRQWETDFEVDPVVKSLSEAELERVIMAARRAREDRALVCK